MYRECVPYPFHYLGDNPDNHLYYIASKYVGFDQIEVSHNFFSPNFFNNGFPPGLNATQLIYVQSIQERH